MRKVPYTSQAGHADDYPYDQTIQLHDPHPPYVTVSRVTWNKYKSRRAKILSITLMVCGVISVGFNALGIHVQRQRKPFYEVNYWFYMATGIWSSLFIILASKYVFGAAKLKTTKMLLASLVVCMVCGFCTVTLLATGGLILAYEVGGFWESAPSSGDNCFELTAQLRPVNIQHTISLACGGSLLVLSMVEAVCVVWLVALSCDALCSHNRSHQDGGSFPIYSDSDDEVEWETYNGRRAKVLSILLMVCAGVCVVLNGIGLYIQQSRTKDFERNIWYTTAAGIWSALLIFIASRYASGASQFKTTRMLLSSLVWSLITVFSAVVLFATSMLIMESERGFFERNAEGSGCSHFSAQWRPNNVQYKLSLACGGSLLVLSLVEGLCAVWLSVLSYTAMSSHKGTLSSPERPERTAESRFSDAN